MGERAKNLYLTGQLLCSEAVLVVLNKELGGGLSDDTAIRLGSALGRSVSATAAAYAAHSAGRPWLSGCFSEDPRQDLLTNWEHWTPPN